MAAISKMTFANAFSWLKNFVFSFELHWSLFLMVQFKSSLVKVMSWCCIGDMNQINCGLTLFANELDDFPIAS